MAFGHLGSAGGKLNDSLMVDKARRKDRLGFGRMGRAYRRNENDIKIIKISFRYRWL